MTPQERLALALQYQKQRDLGSALPSTPAENAARPVQEPEQSWLDKLSEAASGVGYGLGQQVEGLGQMARHPLDTLHSIAVGAGKAMDNPSAAAQAAWQGLKQSAGEAVSSPFNLGQAVGANVNINPRKLAAMLESPAVREIVAYHGTPHRFPATEANPLGEFDASKIGTGEGAQAYGHGVYLAESPNVAQGYAKGVKDNASIQTINNEMSALSKIMNKEEISGQYRKYKSDAGREAAQRYDELMAKRQSIVDAPGNLYHADLPDEMIDRMLDWDKPLSEQPAAVRESLRKLGKEHPLMFGPPDKLWKFRDAINDPNLTGAQIHKQFEDLFGSQKVSGALMRQAGIPGIRYLDEGSRGASGTGRWKIKSKDGAETIYDFKPNEDVLQLMGATAEPVGTRNFVVFPGEEKKVKILERK